MSSVSHNYRQKLAKVQKELKLPSHNLVNDVATRWVSKYKMLSRTQEQLPALTQVFMDDKKHQHLTPTWQDSMVIDTVVTTLQGVHVLTDLLSGEEEVTVSSFMPLLRHIHRLCFPDNDAADDVNHDQDITEPSSNLAWHIRTDISDYI